MHFNVKQLLTAQGADSITMLTGTIVMKLIYFPKGRHTI